MIYYVSRGTLNSTHSLTHSYQLTRYDAVNDIIASASNYFFYISSLDAAEVGHGIYCFDKMKHKCVL